MAYNGAIQKRNTSYLLDNFTKNFSVSNIISMGRDVPVCRLTQCRTLYFAARYVGRVVYSHIGAICQLIYAQRVDCDSAALRQRNEKWLKYFVPKIYCLSFYFHLLQDRVVSLFFDDSPLSTFSDTMPMLQNIPTYLLLDKGTLSLLIAQKDKACAMYKT